MKVPILVLFFIAGLAVSCSKSDDKPACTNKLSLSRDRQIIDSFLQKNGQKELFHFDSQELVYYYIEKPGTGTTKPTIDSLVSFRYIGRLMNGTIVDSLTVKQPPTAPLRTFGSGVRVVYAISQLSKGGKIRLVIPSSSQFGCLQVAGVNIVPPNSQLVYEYELTDMIPSY
ncbi:FKBP-type peptidyl-prolyl cis-trans isomerase [Niabella drilacis]|uniref:Peptidyl-prolyl cis-trans isomerase n=1 Tax=Niabella drilacis (strain DSM 25811 / CCM 8410 / CCUG 62505 / LMG 26954 / E90) TaxID=1285928 RepID=A0A1G6SHK3_NIADE|nr:FKBP-type peptidyl-prolyl cis-trans isomerase [Niabella drilacis]SDD16318.1 FKBP-type peptidyl-prolyl cis-trans isomerase [Niabella drilacis]